MIRFTVACPCGLFHQGLPLPVAWHLFQGHEFAILLTDDLYDEQVTEMLRQATEAVAA